MFGGCSRLILIWHYERYRYLQALEPQLSKRINNMNNCVAVIISFLFLKWRDLDAWAMINGGFSLRSGVPARTISRFMKKWIPVGDVAGNLNFSFYSLLPISFLSSKTQSESRYHQLCTCSSSKSSFYEPGIQSLNRGRTSTFTRTNGRVNNNGNKLFGYKTYSTESDATSKRLDSNVVFRQVCIVCTWHF